MSVEFEIPDWMITPAPEPATPGVSDVDPHRVEALVNRFIAAKQDALYDAPDAFYRHVGGHSLQRLPFIKDRLFGLKRRLLDMPWSDSFAAPSDDRPIAEPLPYYSRQPWEQEPIAEPLPYYSRHLGRSSLEALLTPLTDGERTMLGGRLDAHIDDAMDGINRHVAAQREVLTRQTIGERQRLIQRAAELDHNNDDKLAGLAEAHASAAQELARMNGEPEGPATEAARSTIWRRAVGQRLATGNAAQAVALFDRVKDQIAPADRRHLELPIQLAATDIAADHWIERQAGQPGEPLPSRVTADPDLSPAEKASILTKIAERNSTTESTRVATVQGLDDKHAAAARALATAPATYKPGTFVTLANAYDDAAEPDKAAAARRLAEQENVLGRFAKSSVDEQQRVIGSLPHDAQEAAKAIQRQQTEAFAKDAFAAGTALYPDVGQPVPIDDIEGRIRQARQVAHLRGMPVAPFTADESSDMRRTLAEGTEPSTESDDDAAPHSPSPAERESLPHPVDPNVVLVAGNDKEKRPRLLGSGNRPRVQSDSEIPAPKQIDLIGGGIGVGGFRAAPRLQSSPPKTSPPTPEPAAPTTSQSSGLSSQEGGKRSLTEAEKDRLREGLKKNGAQGKSHEDRMEHGFAQNPNLIFRRQITVEPPGGPPTRMDFLTYDLVTKEFDYQEGKSSESAPLTKNQALSHPKIATEGSVIKGAGKPPFIGGLTLPAKKVKIVRPDDVD